MEKQTDQNPENSGIFRRNGPFAFAVLKRYQARLRFVPQRQVGELCGHLYNLDLVCKSFIYLRKIPVETAQAIVEKAHPHFHVYFANVLVLESQSGCR